MVTLFTRSRTALAGTLGALAAALLPSVPAAHAVIVSGANGTGTGAATVFTPLPGPTGANASGYTESAPNVLRWGDNLTTVVRGTSSATSVVNAGFGNTTLFASTFDQAGTTNESQLSTGDSG